VESVGPKPGTTIGDAYRVERLLGTGAMGVVVLARDIVLERDVAIKIVRRDLLDSDELRGRFLAEARAMARVNHPHVLQIHAFGEFDGAPYFVMELVKGQTVEEWVATGGGSPPDIDLALRILGETCDGAEAIHLARTVHRDLKPSNLLLDASFHVRVADLGLANILRGKIDPRNEIVGTPAYLAPEVALQHEVAPALMPRADVYSLGCIAYELLTGRPPFDGPSMVALMLKHTIEEPPRPSLLRPDLAPEFDTAILRALAKDPAERTPSADAFKRDLMAARDRTSEPVRILVAEDDADFAGALEVMLAREFPYAMIECVSDGRSALDAFDRRRHSVAILDLRMPIIDGMELTGLLRARDDASLTPIIVLTASGGPPEWKRLAAMGADGFLVKPVDLRDVVTLVRRAIADRSRSGSLQSGPPPSRLPLG
jgi:serine/threonine protein kinase